MSNQKSKSEANQALKWLQNEQVVTEHIKKIDIIELLENNGGFYRVENFLPDFVANYILKEIDRLPEKRWEAREDDGHQYTEAAKFSFKLSKPQDGNKSDIVLLVTELLKKLLPEKKAVFRAAKYEGGDHIETHDDHAYAEFDNVKYSRDIAVVFYLTKNWRKEDGGIFIDNANNNKEYVPMFNSMVTFAVPRFHEVTKVEGNKRRLSFFGWFLVEGDLYNYVEDTTAALASSPAPETISRSLKSLQTRGDKRKKRKRS